MKNFASLIQTLKESLYEKGYSEISLGSEAPIGTFIDQIERELNRVAVQSLELNKTGSFFVETMLYSQTTDNVRFKFHFQYDPAKNDLFITSLLSKMGNTKEVFVVSDNLQLVSAETIHNRLVLKEKKLKAKSINRKSVSTKGKRAKR